ncbi:DUF305 domain-containing protein [Streptomyces sp. NPDC006270]|uniref:DUF305 domain-containing protein n=1 Tax=Streptomyces sp. NPDC006270 TaxID=3364741 RepID=UPI0036B716CC
MERRKTRRTRWAAGSAVALALLFAGAATIASARGGGGGEGEERGGTGVPAASSADAGFARDMAVHHQQAVEMSFIVRDRTKDEDVRRLAYDIANTQANQRGMLLGWLDLWELPKVAPGGERPMAWMSDAKGHGQSGHGRDGQEESGRGESGHGENGHGENGRVNPEHDSVDAGAEAGARADTEAGARADTEAGARADTEAGARADAEAGTGARADTGADGVFMAGMAGRSELVRLGRLDGEQAEVFFLQLMTDHHEGGVAMAEACASRCSVPAERRLARGMVEGQRSELGLMRDMLAERGAKPRS